MPDPWDIPPDIGEQIKRARRARRPRLSQRALAEATGVGERTITGIEAGERGGQQTLDILMRYLCLGPYADETAPSEPAPVDDPPVSQASFLTLWRALGSRYSADLRDAMTGGLAVNGLETRAGELSPELARRVREMDRTLRAGWTSEEPDVGDDSR